MSIEINQTIAFGMAQGDPFNDLVTIGGFPSTQKITRIKKIELYAGWVIDRLRITYGTTDGDKVVSHAYGQGGFPTSISFNDNEVLLGVNGVADTGLYAGKTYLHTVRFIISDTKTGAVRVEGPFGVPTVPVGQLKPFTVAGPIIAFAGLAPNAQFIYLPALSFVKQTTPGVTF